MPETGSPPIGGRNLRRVEFWAVGGVVAFVAILALVSFWAGAGTVLEPLGRLSWPLVATLLGLSLVNYLLRAWRWQYFCDGLGLHVPWRRNLLYFFAGFAMTPTPGKTGEVLRLWLIERCHGHPYERTAPLFLGDRWSDMAAVVLYCLAGAGAFSDYQEVTLAAAILLGLMMLLFMHPGLLRWLRALLARTVGRRFPAFHRRLDIMLDDTGRLFTVKLLGFGMVLALIGWLAEIYELNLLLGAMGAPITLQQASFIFTFSIIAGTVAMLPGGLGGTEAMMLALLTSLHVELGTAIAATAMIRFTTLWFATLMGFVALPIAMRTARRAAAEATVAT
jgi:uncharacterized protein (TIRG00374 family)